MKNAWFLTIIAALCAGSIPPFAKISLELFSPFTLVCIRFLIATISLLPFVLQKGDLSRGVFKKTLGVALIGSINPILLFLGLPLTQSAAAPMIYATVPILTVVYMTAYKKQVIFKEQILGVLLGFLGVIFIILLPLVQSGAIDFSTLSGNILLFLAAIAFTIYGIVSKEKQMKLGISYITVIFYFCLITFVVSIPLAFWEIIQRGINWESLRFETVASTLELGLFGTTIFYLSFQKSLQVGSELTAFLYTYLQPIATIILAIILLNEKITLPFLVGGILAIVGAQLAYRRSNSA